ncbi:MAG: hypothetical protein HYX69_16880 [Planctomycetia bacterium]|nr:hypothetical protein [Planctomycetia bacterium]
MSIVRLCLLSLALACALAGRAPAVEPGELLLLQRRPTPATASREPDPASVVRYGPAYRYPQAGWTVLHVEGAPYERGYQHGRLMAAEIVDYITTLATRRSPKSPKIGWRDARILANALFLRRYDPEYLEEMKGIADGAAAAKARYDDRPVDLVDIVTLNSEIEMDFLAPGLHAAATGLDAQKFSEPVNTERPRAPEDHCSAFAATAPATADGQIVFGHITMAGLPGTHYYNVWIDLKPTAGHRVVMQGYPGGIMSGLDYYMNDAGLLVLETTIRQTAFDVTGLALASRIRRAVQYGDTIDKAVEILREANNGLYSNEWMLADTKTGEVAMFELGTHKARLWRSSRNEWPGDTAGFYWGCNNAKDLEVRKETLPSLSGRPGNLVFRPSDRDRAWLRLFEAHRGKLAADFGFESFTTAPLAAFPSCDAKFTTTALAKELKSWALFGPPLGATWNPSEEDEEHCPGVRPLVANDWTLLAVDAVGPPSGDPPVVADLDPFPEEKEDRFAKPVALAAAWRGTLLPKTAADTWLAAASANYERIVALDKAQKQEAKDGTLDRKALDRLDVALFAFRSQWLTAARRLGHDVPLAETRFDWHSDDWYHIAAGHGVMLLAALREEMGADAFERMMDEFGQAHAGQEVDSGQFRAAAEKAAGKPLAAFTKVGLLTSDAAESAGPGFWSIDSFEEEPQKALIVYGTLADRAAQREAAELLSRKIARRWSNVSIPAKSDQEVEEDDLAGHHLLLVGRPATNSVTARFADALPVRFGTASFVVRDETYAHAGSAVIAAGSNPANPRYSVVVYAGLGADATWHAVQSLPDEDPYPAQVMLLPARRHKRFLCVSPPVTVAKKP